MTPSMLFGPGLLVGLAACARTSPSSSSASTSAGNAAPGPDDAGAPGAGDEEQPAARFRACAADADCAAVDRVGCCHNGWKAAVAVTAADAYAKSFTCPEAHPMCAMYIVRDDRAARCDARSHLCTLASTRPGAPAQ